MFRIIHVLAVVHWIGGLLFVTFVLLPSLSEFEPARRLPLFDALERRFARQARVSTLLAGISGFYMLHAYDHWSRVLGPRFWWFGAMIALCALLVVMLFIAEPLVLHSRFSAAAKRNPDRAFRIALRGHRLLSLVALITVLGAVGGAHGLFF